MSAEWATVGITTSMTQPFLDAFVAKDVTAWECNGNVISGEGLGADNANLGRFEPLIDQDLHIACR
jgi:hypothetical protein